MLSDEQAAAAASAAGDRARLSSAQPDKIFAMEPASFSYEGGRTRGKICAAPSLIFRSRAPRCIRCQAVITWLGPPARRKGLFRYSIRCDCGEDTITVRFRLCMGGPASWWRSLGWSGFEE